MQIGTVVCWKTLVPHTGKAVAGVWPAVVQGWALAKKPEKIRMVKNSFLIMAACLGFVLELTNI
jgi:hypothetical protein